MKEQRHAAMYLRISLDHTGEGLGVARQREACRKIAKDRGWTIYREYVDNSISASDKNKDRPEYSRMEKDYRAGHFNALICWDLDRLTRQPRQLEDWIDAAEEKGLHLVTANGEADLGTDGGRMYARIKAAVARAEVERKSARQIAAARQRSDMGKPPMGVRLTGYTVKGEVIEDEAKIVRFIFDQFLKNVTLREIARDLQTQGVPTRSGGKWSPSTVRQFLLNPRYAGRAIYRGRETGERGNWEPLVSDTDFDLVQAIISDPRRKQLLTSPTERKHLGSGIFYCTCGRPMRSFAGGTNSPRGAQRYRCAEGCHSRSMKPIDDLVMEVVRRFLARPEMVKAFTRANSPDTAPLLRDLEAARARVHLIEQDYDAGLIDGRRYKIATDKALEKIHALENQLATLSNTSDLGKVAGSHDPVEAFNNLDLLGKRSVIDALVKVTIGPAPRGHKGFNPETVSIEWRKGSERE